MNKKHIKKNKKLRAGQESLEEILQRIKQYMPKIPRVKKKETKPWKLVSDETTPSRPPE